MSDIVLDAVYPHPPERVWRALTDPQELAMWLMPNDFVPKLGHKFQFRAKPRGTWRGIVDCEVLELDAPRKLSYSWLGDPEGTPTRVTWTLTPVEAGTRLMLEHRGFRGIGGLFLRWLLGSGWKKMLRTKLRDVLAGVAVGPNECH
jgi:uncharacterized protein YndB with AHSA1/START domain